MGFFFLVLINLFMWALFYLVISLKLEKSASEFREQRLRKEMDEIIREFNAAADRNISLLENRIEQYKKLLDSGGEYSKVDFVIGDEDNFERVNEISEDIEPAGETPDKNNALDVSETDRDLINLSDKQDFFSDFFSHAKDKLNSFKSIFFSKAVSAGQRIKSAAVRKSTETRIDDRSFEDFSEPLQADPSESDFTEEARGLSHKSETGDISIGKSFKDILPEFTREPDEIEEEIPADDQDSERLHEEKIISIVKSGSDKFTIVKDLHNLGLDVSNISEYTGIPDGEVKLIVNLSAGS